MQWACLTLPDLPLDVLFGTAGFDAVDPDVPQAVIDGPDQRPLVLRVNAAAAAQGVRVSQTLAAARVYAPTLVARRRQPRRERERLDTLAAWAYGYSSHVVVQPSALLLEVGASCTLFDGWERLQRRLREGLNALGHRHVLAAAPTIAGADVLAHAGVDVAVRDVDQLRNALAAIPLSRSGLAPALVQALEAVGWRRLDTLLRAPRGELSRRFDPMLPGWIDRLTGAAPDPRPLYRPPDAFERLLEFDGTIESLEALAFPLRRLCIELAMFLQIRDGGVLQFDLVIGHDDAPATRTTIGLRQPQRDVEPLLDAARGRLERTPLPGPVRSLALQARQLPPFVPEKRDLFDPATRGGLDWNGLETRLRGQLGDDAVRTLAVHADHRPERATRSGDVRSERRVPAAVPRQPRPLWLLPRPQPLRQPIARLLRGPERIESGWWDGEDARRDYVVAELEGGQRAWLFRATGAGGPWMLHGWFA